MAIPATAALVVGVPQANAAAAGSATTPGVDVSSAQGPIDWSFVPNSGALFVYIKSTEGIGSVDSVVSIKGSGYPQWQGFYHVARPDQSNGAAQADFFLNNYGGWVNDGATLPPAIDLEYNPVANGPACYGLTKTDMVVWIQDFSTTMFNATNRYPVIRTNADWWSTCTGGDTTIPATDPLWDTGRGQPAAWSTVAIQQTGQAAVPGMTGLVDQDVFNGMLWSDTFLRGTGPDKIDERAALDAYLGPVDGFKRTYWKGWVELFQNNNAEILYDPASGAFAVQGAIYQHYGINGWNSSSLGFPTSEEIGTPDGVGRYSRFQGGAIYWTPSTKAATVLSHIQDKWASLGAERSFLGYPTTDTSPDVNTGSGEVNHFQGGSIYWTWEAGAWSVHGAIEGKWTSMGAVTSPLGYPVTDESGTPDGVGRYNHFADPIVSGPVVASASIYWTPKTGAWSIRGSIRDKWASLGWERSFLEYPTTDETTTPDGVGRYNHFANDGSIYWTPGTGAWSVRGSIRDRWASLGWELSVLGYPVTDENGTPDGVGRYNHFQGGSIYWSPGTGAWEVHGSIRDTWSSLGWERSRLGYPVSNEYGVPGGRRSDFQHGSITWIAATGAIQVTYS
jgi:uncharacterized protein with LGFP repeats/GH25 family lysozyme M1 (1,4-beta-N-acetylmuramidase)